MNTSLPTDGNVAGYVEAKRFLDRPSSAASRPMHQEIFNLDEGPVTLTYPAALSVASYQDLEDHLAIFLRKAKRRAEALRAEAAELNDPDEVLRG
jgi:hypothetical protein